MTDGLQFWRDSLAGKKPEINVDLPQQGYYKARKGKDGPWAPVAIWLKGDDLVARHGDEMVEPARIWSWCADKPVSKADVEHYKEHGRFPGEIAIGHNSGDLSLAEEMTDAAKQAIEWLKDNKITAQVTADIAANMRARLLDLSKKAETERETKVRPHLDAQKAINGEYKPLVDAATSAANALRDALTVFMRAEEAKQRAQAEAKRKAEEEQAAKERAELLKANPLAEYTEPLPEPPLPLEPPKVQAGGQAGRKAGLRTITRFELTDYAAALEHVKNHKDVIAAVEKAAFAQAKAGADVPGVKRIEERVAA
jgi:hypothetical protein